ncbi:MAG: DUF5048 domain-containing protein [Burkholderiales bacterium]|nr:DUF5048 domain-containing protein [Burkholderiales bacterium]
MLNLNFQLVDNIEGKVIDDSFSFDSTSDIRRTYNVTFHVTDSSFAIGIDKKIWMDKYLEIYVGVLNVRTNEIYKYPMGIYAMEDSNSNYSTDTSTLSLSCSDLVTMLNGTVSGQLRIKTVIAEGANIRSAMIDTITNLGGFSRYRISDMDKTVPYDLEFTAGASVWEIISKIRDLYAGWETFFDTDGTFVCQPIPTCENDPVIFASSQLSPLVISEAVNSSLKDVKNVTRVYGKCLDTDYYTDTVSGTGSSYTLTFTAPPSPSTGTTIAFKCNANNSSGFTIIFGGTTYSVVDDNEKSISADVLQTNSSYVFRYRSGKFYYQGQWQIIGIAKEVLTQPTQAQIEADYIKENCRNIKYIVNPDSPYAIERIGERLNVCSGGDFDKISSEPLALQRSEYENWLKTRMVDTVTLEMTLVPWLNMNEKIEYTLKQKKETYQFITKKMSGSVSKWTMSLEISRFFPIYPFITT